MNRIHRVIFNTQLGIWQAVCECARGRGKGGRQSRRTSRQGAAAGSAAHAEDTALAHTRPAVVKILGTPARAVLASWGLLFGVALPATAQNVVLPGQTYTLPPGETSQTFESIFGTLHINAGSRLTNAAILSNEMGG
uniref:ESPR domain-containing protein n=1 Tax=Hydrogenophaga palleronii TaxID=65655 RepID=UPI000A3E9A86